MAHCPAGVESSPSQEPHTPSGSLPHPCPWGLAGTQALEHSSAVPQVHLAGSGSQEAELDKGPSPWMRDAGVRTLDLAPTALCPSEARTEWKQRLQWVELPLQHQQPMWECWFETQLQHFQSSFQSNLLMHLGK